MATKTFNLAKLGPAQQTGTAAEFAAALERWAKKQNPADRSAELLRIASGVIRQLEALRLQEARRSATARRALARWTALAPRLERELAAAAVRPRGKRTEFQRDSAGEIISARSTYE